MKENLTTIIVTIALLKQANCEDHVRLSELARELGTTKTHLMSFINSHPGLFATYEPDTGRKGAGKNPGLHIADAFPSSTGCPARIPGRRTRGCSSTTSS